MKTSELLEHVTKHMLDDRAELLEGASDALFDDATVLRYLNEAQRKLARAAGVIEDRTTPEVCEIQLVAGEVYYDLHPSILIVKAVRFSDSDLDLARTGYDDTRPVASLHAYAPDHWDVNAAYT